MKFSIITATYNSEAHILSAIRSVQEQTYLNIELIVVDGGSSDRTLEIIRENYKRELKLISEKDKGIYDALNKGLRMATGDVIGFVHSDDMLASRDIIEKLAGEFSRREVQGIYGDLKYVSQSDLSKTLRYWESNDFKDELLHSGWMPAHPTLFLKREVYEKTGEFDLSYKIAADYDFILRVFKNPEFKFQYIPEVFTLMRSGGASNRSFKNIILKSKEDLRALKQNKFKRPLGVLIAKNFSKVKQFVN